MCLISFLIGFARLYVGVHSIDQIIYGWQLGIWLAYYFNFCLRDFIIHHITYLVVRSHQNKLNTKKYVVWSSVVFIVVFSVQWIDYLIVEDTFVVPQEWIDNLALQCGSRDQNNTLQYKSLVYAGLCALAYGAYLGVLVHKHYYGIMWRHMFRTNWKKFLLRYLVMGAMALPFGLPFLLIPWSAPLWVLLIFKTLLPTFAVSFVIFGFSHYFFERFGLINPDERKLKLLIN